MFTKRLSSLLSILAATAVLTTVGCAKKPKINLAGLQQSPHGAGAYGAAGSVGGAGADGFAADSISGAQFAALNGADGDGFGGTGTGAGLNEGPGAWGDLNEAVSGAETSNFLKNGSYWSEKIYFDYNRAEVKASERGKLDALAVYLKENPGFGTVIEGHCDERGSDEYNRALSERRSLAVRDYLGALGVDVRRMETISYGEDRPVIPNATTEAEHSQNRRAEFLIGPMR